MHRESATRIQREASQINRTGGTKIEHFQSTEEKKAVKSTSSLGCNCVTWKDILKLWEKKMTYLHCLAQEERCAWHLRRKDGENIQCRIIVNSEFEAMQRVSLNVLGQNLGCWFFQTCLIYSIQYYNHILAGISVKMNRKFLKFFWNARGLQ